VIRSQVSEGSSLADGIKTAVAEFQNNYGRFSSAGNKSYGLAEPASIQGSYVVSVGVGSTGKIVAHFSSTDKKANTKIGGKTLVFSPVTHAGSIEWNCKTTAGTSVANKYRPTICRD
jgi:type IV pilus assembly protein PilA